MYEFWYDYIKPKHGEKAKHCYMEIDSCIFHVKTEDIYKDIAEDFEIDRPLPLGKYKKVIRLIKNELRG